MRRNPRFVWPLVALVLAGTAVAVPAAEPPVRTIEVSAASEIYVPPDEVLLTLTARSRDKQLLVAKAENDRLTRSVLSLGDKYKIPKERFQIDYFNIGPIYERARQGAERKLVGYGVTRSIQITLRDFAVLEPLVSDALEAGITEVDEILFRTTKHREHQFEARRLAVVHAKEKASHLAELNGLKLGKPITIEHGLEGDEHTPVFASVATTIGGGGQESWTSEAAVVDHALPGGAKVHLIGAASALRSPQPKAADAAKEPEPIAPGVLTISATVTITFEMVD